MRRTSATGSPGGFTLLELLVVLAVLGLAAALIPLALDRALPARRVATTVDSLVSLVRNAQVASIDEGRPIKLILSDRALAVDTDASHRKPAHASVPSSVGVTLTNADGVPSSAFRVFPDGSAEEVHFIVRAGSHQTDIMLSGLTGRLFIVRRR